MHEGNDMNTGKYSTDQLIQIGRRMVAAHSETESINDAIDLYHSEYPDIDEHTLTLIWFGINCKDRESIGS